MNEFMEWAECQRKFVRKVFADANKIKSILKAISKRGEKAHIRVKLKLIYAN